MPREGRSQAQSGVGQPKPQLWSAIDRSSPVPYYVQIKEALRENIDHGLWSRGDQIPGEPELCERFGVSRTVVRQALKELTYEGLLVREKGKGTFVAEPKISESLVQRLTGFYQDMVERGHRPETVVMRQELVPVSAKVATFLLLEPGTPVIHIDRLRSVDGTPIVLVSTYLPHNLCAGLLDADLSDQSLYEFVEKECGLTLAYGRRTIGAVPASEYEAKLLKVDKGAPLILLDSVSYLADGSPVEYYRALHRGDRSQFEVELVRIQEQGDRRRVLGAIPADLPRSNTLIEHDQET